MKKYELTCASLDVMPVIKDDLLYPLTLIFQGKENTVNNSNELASEIDDYKLFCNNKLLKLINNTRTDLL